MRRILPVLATVVAVAMAPAWSHADVWNIDASHSSITFTVTHLGISKVHGRFNTFSGSIDFDGENVQKGTTSVKIDVATIDTDDEKRDGHMRGPDFFDVEKHPNIEFKSTSVSKKGDGFVLNGDLTFNGKTQKVAIPFELIGVADDPWGNTRAGFEGTLTLKREDWNLGWEDVKYRPPLIGNDVKISLSLETIKAKS